MLQKQLELKDNEIYDLTAKLNDLENQFCRNEDERANLQKLLNGLNDIKNSQNYKIEQLIEDNKTLKQICEEQDNEIKQGNEERQNMNKELEKKNNDIVNLNSQIRGEINEINNLQNQLNKNNGLSLQYESNIKDYQRQMDFFKRENENLKNNIYKEKAINSDEDQKNKEFSNILGDKDQKINQLTQDIENVKVMQQNEDGRNNVLQEENTKLRNHIMTLTEQNQNLINEIDAIIEEDEKAKYVLDRKKRISSLLLNNRNTIDQSLNNLDEGINKRNNYENYSPISKSRMTYDINNN
jgi:chromosome segregation ATPase